MRWTRNSNLLGKVTVVLVICCLVIVSFYVNTAVALDGSGTEQEPWRIKSLDDFNDFAADANYWDDYTRLETDVNLAGQTYSTAVIAPDTINSNHDFDGTAFTGVFDGNDHKIANLTIDGGTNEYLGLFGCILDAELRNLGIEGGSVNGDWAVGGLLGGNFGIVSNCYFTGNVSGNDCLGGLVGYNFDGTVMNCNSISDISGGNSVGGLIGYNFDGTAMNCYSIGDVSGYKGVGGLVGYNFRNVSNCYSTGNVSGSSFVGGLVGQNGFVSPFPPPTAKAGYIHNNYSTGNVYGISNVGGLVGDHVWGEIEGAFWDIQTSGQLESDGGTGKSTDEMRQQFTFTDWDFINVWNIGENQTYPYLRVYLPSDINKDGIVNFLDIAITANQWMQEQ